MRSWIQSLVVAMRRSEVDALRQIEEKGYARPYAGDSRQLFKIGVSFSSGMGTIEEWEVES